MGHRGEAPAGKDVSLDKIDVANVALIQLIGDRDSLQNEQSIRFQQSTAALEIGVEELMADRLNHFNRDKLVVLAFEIAVILHHYRHAIAQSGIGDATRCQFKLFLRNRRRRHSAAEITRGVQSKTTPTGSDFEEMVLRRESEFLANPFILRRRCIE